MFSAKTPPMGSDHNQSEFSFIKNASRRPVERVSTARDFAKKALQVTCAGGAFMVEERQILIGGLNIEVLEVPSTPRTEAALREALEQLHANAPVNASAVREHMVLRRTLDIIGQEGLSSSARLRMPVAMAQRLHELYAFQVHVHSRRDVFVALWGDLFVGRMGIKRRLLEREFNTRVLTRDEFMCFCERRRPAAVTEAQLV
jgi:hypothetical protein